MTVPEAAVNEDHEPMARQNEVRASGKIAPVQAKAITHTVDDSPDGQFWPRVARSYSGHHAASPLGTDDVHR